MCPTDLWKLLTAQQHLVPMREHIVTVINSHTLGLAPTIMGSLSEEAGNHDAGSDDFVESGGDLYRLEARNGKKFCTKSRYDVSKGTTKVGGREKPTKMLPLWTHVSHQGPTAEPTLAWMGPPKSVDSIHSRTHMFLSLARPS